MYIKRRSRRVVSRKAQRRNDQLFLRLAVLYAGEGDWVGVVKNLNRIIFDTIPPQTIIARPEFRSFRKELRRLYGSSAA